MNEAGDDSFYDAIEYLKSFIAGLNNRQQCFFSSKNNKRVHLERERSVLCTFVPPLAYLSSLLSVLFIFSLRRLLDPWPGLCCSALRVIEVCHVWAD